LDFNVYLLLARTLIVDSSGIAYLHWLNFCGGKYRRRSKFHDNSVVVNKPTFAYNIIIFIDQTSTYTITFMHYCKGHLGSGLGLV